ncbi:MAG: hypothetical protein NTV23_01300, partial [Propionibacteriales bacterium]|nr:hypothetical protein [Propionibacteriales bacterium]
APLPAGLTRTGNTISGTPTTPGTTQVVIGFTQTSTGLAATPKTLDLVIAPPPPAPVISTTSLPNASFFQAYSTQVTAVGNPTGTWTATIQKRGSGSANDGGFSMSSSGVLSNGLVLQTGVYDVTLNFTATGNPTPATPVVLTLTVT